ncbi:hypothetical protein ACA910_022576 [Epithemia clementina (nom. ined.)]
MQSAAAANNENESNTAATAVVRILALHGSEGNGQSFENRFSSWKTATQQREQRHPKLDLQITSIDAPVRKGKGFAWWSMPPGVRSFTADHYEFFDQSCDLVVQEYKSAAAAAAAAITPNEKHQEPSHYDLILGFSQGAILATSLLALGKIQPHPRIGYILIGGAWPNPFTKELETLNLAKQSLGVNGGNTDFTKERCRVLIVVGDRDQINPPEQSLRVQQALQDGGCDVTTIHFDGGHVVPSCSTNSGDDDSNDDTVRRVLDWIAAGL